MNCGSKFLGWSLCLLCASPAVADSWMAPRDSVFASPSGECFAMLIPARLSGKDTLTVYNYDREAARGSTGKVEHPAFKVAWHAELEYLPHRLLVSDEGWVIGIDQYAHLGHDHALVVFEPDGKRIADYSLAEILPQAQREEFVNCSVSSCPWASGLKHEFVETPYVERSMLYLELRWGAVLVVDLETGRIGFGPAAESHYSAMLGFRDRAAFTLYSQATQIGEVSCVWHGEGHFTAQGQVHDRGEDRPLEYGLRADKRGRWQVLETPHELVRDGSALRRKRTDRGETALGPAQTIPAHTYPMYRNDWLPALWSQVVRNYDRDRGGLQPHVAFFAGERNWCRRGALWYTTTVRLEVNGRSRSFDIFENTERRHIWSDRDGRIYLIETVDHQPIAVRQGYEPLIKSARSAMSLAMKKVPRAAQQPATTQPARR